MKSLIWIVLFIVLGVVKKDYLYKLYVFLILSIPFNEYIYDLGGLIGGTVSILDCALLIMFILSMNKLIKIGKINMIAIDRIVLIFSIMIFIYTFLGYINNQPRIMGDFITFFRIILCYIVYRIHLIHEVNIHQYLKLIIAAFCIYSIIVIIIYLFKERLLPLVYGKNLIEWWGTARVGFSNTTNLLLVPMFIFNKNVNKLTTILALILSTIAIIMSQNRGIMLAYIVIIILQVIIENIKKDKLSTVVFLLLISILTILIFISYKNSIIDVILSSNNGFMKRFAEIINGNIASVNVREVTNSLSMEIAKNNSFKGIGLGATLILYNVDYSIAATAPFIDNGIITMLVKMGIGSIILVIIGLYNLILIIIKTRFNSIYSKINLSIVIVIFVIISGYLNSQIIYSLPVNTFAMFSSIILINRNKYIEL